MTSPPPHSQPPRAQPSTPSASRGAPPSLGSSAAGSRASAEAVARRAERWLVRQGVPQLIEGYRFRDHVLPRMLPFLAGASVTVVALAALLSRTRTGGGPYAIIGILLSGLVVLPALVARARGRRWSRRGTSTVLAGYALTPVAVAVALLGTYGRPGRALTVDLPGASIPVLVGLTVLVVAVLLAAVFGLAGLATAYGVVPLAGRGVRHAATDMRNGLQLQGRAMPVLLFVTFFLFFTGELWQLMNHLSWIRLVGVLALFAAVTVLATSARLRGEIDRVEQDLSPRRLVAACAGTPLAGLEDPPPPAPPTLTARQETNVLLVLATRQLVQALVVGLGLFAFFVVLGLVIVDGATAADWIGEEPQRSALAPFLPVALLRAAALLAGFGSMYFAITAMTQTEYRQEFFEPVIGDVERTLAVRAVYLGVRHRAS